VHAGQPVGDRARERASSSTGTISAMTAPLTPSPEPVSRYTSTIRATVFTASPHREIVCAANKRRYPARPNADRSPGRLTLVTSPSWPG
jgi:hypothetical protein